MELSSFIEPKTVEIGVREYIISKIPAFEAGKVYRELVKLIPDYGDLAVTMLGDESIKIIFSHTAVVEDDGNQKVMSLNSVIEKYLVNYDDFISLLSKMRNYNFGFFTSGNLRELLEVPVEAETE